LIGREDRIKFPNKKEKSPQKLVPVRLGSDGLYLRPGAQQLGLDLPEANAQHTELRVLAPNRLGQIFLAGPQLPHDLVTLGHLGLKAFQLLSGTLVVVLGRSYLSHQALYFFIQRHDLLLVKFNAASQRCVFDLFWVPT